MSDNNFNSLFSRLQDSINHSNKIIVELKSYYDKYESWFPRYLYEILANEKIEIERKYRELNNNYSNLLSLLWIVLGIRRK